MRARTNKVVLVMLVLVAAAAAIVPPKQRNVRAMTPEKGALDMTDSYGFRVGELVPNISFTDLNGTPHALREFRGSAAVVIGEAIDQIATELAKNN